MVEIDAEYKRKFLVIIDETEECDRALTFAAWRVKRTGGTVVLMSVIEPPEMQWMGVEEVMRAEALEAAETNIDRRLARLSAIGGIRTETVIREGNPPEAIEALINADHDIAILVLGASTAHDGPGPLVSHFAAKSRLRIPVTIVPGAMSDDEIIALC